LFESLPLGTKNHFKRKVLAIALDTTGALKPWNTLSDDTIIEIWNLVLGVDHPIDEGDTECYLFIVAKTLVSPLFFIIPGGMDSGHGPGSVLVSSVGGKREHIVGTNCRAPTQT
jgi:hypothetical protein